MNAAWAHPLRFLGFVAWFAWQVVVTSVKVSLLVMTPGRQPRPGIVRVPLTTLSDSELTLLIALITITPDTLVIAVDREARSMHVHGMFVDGDPDAFRSAVADTELRLLRALRRRPPVTTDKGGHS